MTLLGGVVIPGITNKGYVNSAALTAINVTADAADAMTVTQTGTNYTFQVDTSTTDAVTGIKITGAAEGAGVAVAARSSGTNENLTINAKGSGTVTINGTATGAISLGAATGIAGATTITSTSASALTVGRQGATSPVLKVDANTASVATGISITGAAATGGVAVAAISSGTDESLKVDAKGSGTVTINGTGTGNVIVGTALAFGSDAAAAKSIVIGTTNGLKIGTGATQKIGFFGTTPAVQQTKAGHNNWTALSDVVGALVTLGLFDAA
jgi:hypothetical protein